MHPDQNTMSDEAFEQEVVRLERELAEKSAQIHGQVARAQEALNTEFAGADTALQELTKEIEMGADE